MSTRKERKVLAFWGAYFVPSLRRGKSPRGVSSVGVSVPRFPRRASPYSPSIDGNLRVGVQQYRLPPPAAVKAAPRSPCKNRRWLRLNCLYSFHRQLRLWTGPEIWRRRKITGKFLIRFLFSFIKAKEQNLLKLLRNIGAYASPYLSVLCASGKEEGRNWAIFTRVFVLVFACVPLSLISVFAKVCFEEDKEAIPNKQSFFLFRFHKHTVNFWWKKNESRPDSVVSTPRKHSLCILCLSCIFTLISVWEPIDVTNIVRYFSHNFWCHTFPGMIPTRDF